MKYLKIFLLHLQRAFVHRGETMLYIAMSILSPLTMIYLWKGALSPTDTIGIYNLSDLNTYFLTFLLLNNLLTVHIEERIASKHIQHGEILGYLLKPMSYYWQNFTTEMSYRSNQSVIAIVAIVVLVSTLNISFLHPTPMHYLQFLLMAMVGLFISFTYKYILGLTAFWLTDTNGLFNTLIVAELLLGGFVMPIGLYPDWVKLLAHLTPFPYIYYYPSQALLGKLSQVEFLESVALQLFVLILLWLAAKHTWKNGIKKLTAIGQ